MIGRQPGSRFPLFATIEPAYASNARSPLFALGRVIVFRGSPPGVETFGLPCQGSLTAQPQIGGRDLGTRGIRVTVHGAAAGAPALLLIGGSRQQWSGLPLPWPLAAVGLPGCSL